MGKGLSIDVGETTIYLNGNVTTSIDWSDEKVKKAIENVYNTPNKTG